MRKEGSNEKGGVDKIQWGWARRMKRVNLVKRWCSGADTTRIKRQEETYKQGEDIGMSKRVRQRLILPAPEFTAEGFRRRPMISGKRSGRERRTGKPLAMLRDRRLTRPRLAQRISMHEWIQGAEVEKISHQG